METSPPVVLSFLGSFATCMLTALGAAPVLCGHIPSRSMRDSVLCVSVGVMLATLLVSMTFLALDGAKGLFEYGAAPAAIVCFAVFLGLSEVAQINQRIPSERLNPHSKTSDGATLCRVWIFIFAITVHNFPEGFAVAMPLRRQGLSRTKSFTYGQASALVEPIAGVLGAWAVLTFEPILPYALSFAAGAMIFVVVEEVIPETQQDKYTDIATMGFIGGFIIMMTLDVGLG